MERFSNQAQGRAEFNNPPQIHNSYLLAKVAGGGDIMGNVKETNAMLFLELFEQVKGFSPAGGIYH